ncbi:MAG: CaiB/BaiF CoA transferase family protein [Dehalococcoidia bacterium]
MTANGAAPNRRPLAGIRIIDFTNAVAGPTATSILGDLGAEVIKIEAPDGRQPNPSGVAPHRAGTPDLPYNRVITFNERNRSKLGVVLDLARPEGRQLFLELAQVSDAVVENFSPRVMGNLRLDYPDLTAVRPDIILVSMPAFGKSGPYRARASYGPGIDAMSGLSHLTGYEDGPPMKPGNFYCDQNAGLLAASSLLAALRHRRRTGEGQWIECAMIEGELQLVAEALIDCQMNGRVQTRIGNRHPRMAPHGVYPCAGRDAWVAIAVATDAQFVALADLIERPDLAADPRFAALAQRLANQDVLDEEIAVWTRQRDHREAQRLLQAAGVPAGSALNAAELLTDPQVRARESFEYVGYPDIPVPFPHTRVAFRLRGRNTHIERRAPGFGEHNDAVLGDLLGARAERLTALRGSGVVADAPVVAHGIRV